MVSSSHRFLRINYLFLVAVAVGRVCLKVRLRCPRWVPVCKERGKKKKVRDIIILHKNSTQKIDLEQPDSGKRRKRRHRTDTTVVFCMEKGEYKIPCIVGYLQVGFQFFCLFKDG